MNQEICIEQLGSVFSIGLNGHQIQNISDYKITSSASGVVELELKISFKSEFVKFEMLANPKLQSS